MLKQISNLLIRLIPWLGYSPRVKYANCCQCDQKTKIDDLIMDNTLNTKLKMLESAHFAIDISQNYKWSVFNEGSFYIKDSYCSKCHKELSLEFKLVNRDW